MPTAPFDKSRFNTLFQQMISEMTALDHTNVPKIEEIVREFCKMFRLCKGITYLYENPEREARGEAEVQCCFDTGEEGVPVISHRVLTNVMTIAHMTVYMTPDQPPLTEEEYQHCDLVMRTVVSFMSRNRMRNLVEKLAYTDDVGYPNIRRLMSAIMQKYGNRPLKDVAAVNYNLRHFSLVNQQIGRKAGDEVMRNHFRTVCSIAGEDSVCTRLGGDNFVAIFRKEQLDEMLGFLSEGSVPYGTDGETVTLACSVGAYCYPDGTIIRVPSDIMEKIVSAFRVAQSGGKEHVVFYDNRIHERKERVMRIQQLFPEALRKEEFHVFYQPKVNIETGELFGAEALCRWFHGDKMITPGEFIPVLEQTTDICKLDFLMLELVCRDIMRWKREGRQLVRISVNLSRKHMMDSNLTQSIMQIIDCYQVPHDLIEIELTETTTDVEFRDLKRVVNSLQSEGIITSVDDFGVGYSSLTLLRAIPWNVLKIDRSFLPLDDEASDSPSSTMFRHVVSMAKALGIECITEGVETRRQVEILRENGCTHAQGFYFDKPLPVEAFEQRLDRPGYPIAT